MGRGRARGPRTSTTLLEVVPLAPARRDAKSARKGSLEHTSSPIRDDAAETRGTQTVLYQCARRTRRPRQAPGWPCYRVCCTACVTLCVRIANPAVRPAGVRNETPCHGSRHDAWPSLRPHRPAADAGWRRWRAASSEQRATLGRCPLRWDEVGARDACAKRLAPSTPGHLLSSCQQQVDKTIPQEPTRLVVATACSSSWLLVCLLCHRTSVACAHP